MSPSARSRVLRLPGQGVLVVGTDLQGNLGDLEKLLAHFEAEGPQASLVLTGDVVHGPPDALQGDWPVVLGTQYRDESVAVVERLWAAQAKWPGRVHVLLGNHEHGHVGGPITSKFHDDEGAVLEGRFGKKRAEKFRAWVSALPWVAVAPCGAVLLHAAPSAQLETLAQLDQLPLAPTVRPIVDHFVDDPVLGQLLWSRAATDAQANAFVQACGGTFALFGHDVVREGFVREGAHQLCVSTSFGLFDADKTWVRLEASARYADATVLREGHELRKLHP